MALVENIDTVARPTANEAARQKFVSALRRAVMMNLADDMRDTYERAVEPALTAKTGATPAPRDIRNAMEDQPVYKFYSGIRYNAQEMVWESVRPQVERGLPRMIELADDVAQQSSKIGSLRLDPTLSVPRYVSEFDVHLMPGCFHSEHADKDVAQGATYVHGVGVFTGGLLWGNNRGPGMSIARYLQARYPDFKPKRILDLGCTTGSNTFPYAEVFPDAEVHGVDVGAPVLRYGHARAEARGLPIQFSQQNAEHLDFADESFDLITSSFFLHEIPVSVTRNVFKECRRLLRPDGLMLHFELPPGTEVDPYYDFYLDWDTWYNNEPSYAQFRSQKPSELCLEAGFDPAKFVKKQIYNWGTVPEETFDASVSDDVKLPVVANGATWFTFGAWK